MGDGHLQALAVGLQVRDGFDLAVAQKGGFCDVSVQLENFSTQKVGRSLDALEVVPDRAQQNAILEVQGWEASELFRRLPGHFVTAFPDQNALHGPRLRKGCRAVVVLVDTLPNVLQSVVLTQSIKAVILPCVIRRQLRVLQR